MGANARDDEEYKFTYKPRKTRESSSDEESNKSDSENHSEDHSLPAQGGGDDISSSNSINTARNNMHNEPDIESPVGKKMNARRGRPAKRARKDERHQLKHTFQMT